MRLTLTVESGSLAGRVLELQEGSLQLGRGDDCALRFDQRVDKEVSRRHARIQAEGGDFYIADEQSTNGTLVNGQRIFRQVLRSGDVIELGYRGPRLRVAVEKPPAPSVATPATVPGMAAAPPVVPNAPAPAGPDWRLALTSMTSYNPVLDKGRPDNRTPILIAVGVMLLGAFFTLTMMLTALFEMSLLHALMGTLVAFLPAPFYLALWLWLDRYDPEPAWALAGAWLWGGGVATFISYIFNTLTGSVTHAVTGSAALASFMTSSVSAPLVEEFTKGLPVVLILLLLRREFDGVLDGIVYAGVVALGFATVENILYYGRNFMTAGFSGLFITFFVRGLLDPFGHSVYTAMTGIGCGISRIARQKVVRYVAPLAGYAVAVMLHSLWNSISSLGGNLGMLVYYLLIWVPLLLAFLGVVLWIGAREAKLIRSMLEFEVSCRLITAEQAAIVGSWLKRLAWVFGAFGDGKKFSARRRFLHAATRLAFSYWHADRAREAGTQTLSLARIPFFRKELETLQPSV